jgi:hypothetical protein
VGGACVHLSTLAESSPRTEKPRGGEKKRKRVRNQGKTVRKWLKLMLRIREVPASNIVSDIGYSK